MAWLLDASGDYVDITDDAVLTLPDGDWTISIWCRQTSGLQSYSQRLLASGIGAPTTNKLDISINASGNYDTTFTDGGGDNASPNSTSTPFASNTSWTHVLAQRTGGGSSAATFTMYTNGTSSATATNNAVDSIDVATGVLTIGNRDDAARNRGFIGSLAEYAKWDRALTVDEISALAKGFSPAFFTDSLIWYIPMIRDYTEKLNGLTLTNNSTTVTDHPRIIYPAYTLIGISPATTQTLTAPLLTITPTFFGPSLAQTITAPLLDNAPSFFSPTFVPGSVNIAPPLLDNTPTFYGPTLAATYNLTAPLLTNTPTFPGPTLAATYALTAPLLTNTPTFYGPTFAPGQVSLTAPLLTNTATFPAATFTATYNLVAPVLSNAPSFYGPTFLQAGLQTIAGPLLTNTPMFYGATIGHKWIDTNNVTTGVWTDTDIPFTEI